MTATTIFDYVHGGTDQVSPQPAQLEPTGNLTPSATGDSEDGPTIRYVILDSPVGRILIAATERGVCRVFLGDFDETLEAQLEAEFPDTRLRSDADRLAAWAREIRASLDSHGREARIPLDAPGTPFQHRVWNHLRLIPRGQTQTYTEVADAVGLPRGARAVARACATNPVSVVVPCHRVVRRDGGLGGYRWGIARKRALLERERSQLDRAEAEIVHGLLPHG
jgi:AraC family transcriptional regulator of adaptative response/methylated-DNA-[protein]-cysteine methyltransferase